MSDYSRGSEWRKWDIHIHAPSSALNNQFEGEDIEDKWALYINKLESLTDIAALGITDYFSIDGYLRVRDFQDEDRLDNIDLILPNVELRILPVTDQDRAINIHVIFDPEVVNELERLFFRALIFKYEGDDYHCDREGLTLLGKKYLGSGANDEVAYGEGVNQFKVDFSALREVLRENKYLEGRYLVAVANSSRDGASGIQHSSLAATRQEIYRLSHVIFSSRPGDRAYFLGKGTDSPESVISQYGSLKPCIHGSDAHDLETICRPTDNRFTWIKSDPTFEGLKQIVYEPEWRVRVQDANPAESETYAKINSLAITFPTDLAIKEEKTEEPTTFCLNGDYNLQYSNNLTCFIGGRGTGKSALAHIIYNNWINRDPKRLTAIDSPLENLLLEPDPFRSVADYTTCDIPSQAEFFFQNEIEGFAKNLESISRVIRNRLERLSFLTGGDSLKDLIEQWNEHSNSVDNVINSYDQITELNSKISVLQEIIDTLKKQTEIIQSETYIGHQQKIGNITTKIAEFNSYENEYELLITEIDSLEKTIDQLEWTDEQGGKLLTKLSNSIERHRGEIQTAHSDYNTAYTASNYEDQLRAAQKELSDYLTKRGLAPENVQELAEASTRIKANEEQIKNYKQEKTPHEQIYNDRAKIFELYKEEYTTYKTKYDEITSVLHKKLAHLPISSKEIKFTSAPDDNRLKEYLYEFLKKNLEEQTRLWSDAIDRLFFSDVNIEEYITDKENIRKRISGFTGTEKHKSIIQQFLSDDTVLEKLHLGLLKYYYDIENIQVRTTLGGKLLKNTSFGERCGILISIILAAGTNPIVIDQPEDHLDGRFISEVLVPLVRQQKQNRQIILITRDANVVVGGDAELIHILEGDNSRTQILPCTIENTDHRHKYIWVLDGGEEAFAKREQKYDIEPLGIIS